MEWTQVLEPLLELLIAAILTFIFRWAKLTGRAARAREIAQRAADLAALIELNDLAKPEPSRLTPHQKAERIGLYLRGQKIPPGVALRVAAGAVAKHGGLTAPNGAPWREPAGGWQEGPKPA